MMIYDYYYYIRNQVNSIYMKHKINSYPVSIKKILKEYSNIKTVKYSYYVNKYGLSIHELKNYLCSDDGCSVYDPNTMKYIILYNDLECSKQRIRWTLAHELGHIFLKHHYDCYGILIKNLSYEEYKSRETAANLFASWFLAHPIVLNNLDILKPHDLTIFCGLSETAAKIRYKRFKKYEENIQLGLHDNTIAKQFEQYIKDKHDDYLFHQRFVNAFNFG